ncbi:hypothetical protein ACXWPN_10095, partial [Streptococcus pyogenes]
WQRRRGVAGQVESRGALRAAHASPYRGQEEREEQRYLRFSGVRQRVRAGSRKRLGLHRHNASAHL